MVYRKKAKKEELPEGIEPVVEYEKNKLSTRGNGNYPVSQPMTSRPWFWNPFKCMDDRMRWELNCKRHDAERRRIKADATEYCFRYNGKLYNRYDMMAHIVMMAFDGWELPRILDDLSDEHNVLPTPKELHKWMELHPNFKKELEMAKTYRGEIYNDMAIQAVTTAGAGQAGGPTRDQVGYAKLLADTFMAQAALANERFQTVNKQQIQDVTDRSTPEQIKERIAAMLEANPQLAELAKSYQEKEIAVEPIVEVESGDAINE